MKKSITALSLFVLLVGVSPFAKADTFDIKDEQEVRKKCKKLEIKKEVLSCKGARDFKTVKSAKVGSEYWGTGLDAIHENDLDVIFDLGILPDGDTDSIYSFVRKLVDEDTKKQVGYITYEGFKNDEIGVRLQVVKRFNLAAQLVMVTVESK